jgi:hypothetical protein
MPGFGMDACAVWAVKGSTCKVVSYDIEMCIKPSRVIVREFVQESSSKEDRAHGML